MAIAGNESYPLRIDGVIHDVILVEVWEIRVPLFLLSRRFYWLHTIFILIYDAITSVSDFLWYLQE